MHVKLHPMLRGSSTKSYLITVQGSEHDLVGLQVLAVNYAIADGVFLLQLERLHGFRQSCPLPGNHRGLEIEINVTWHFFGLTACSSEVYGVPRDQCQQMYHSSLTIMLFLEVCWVYKEQKSDKMVGLSTG